MENQEIVSEDKLVSWIDAKVTLRGPDYNSEYVSAKKFGDYLIGIDETIRFFITVENKDLKLIPFEIPVRVIKGSIVSEIVKAFDLDLIRLLAAYGAGKYIGPALETMAKNDFKDQGFKSIFSAAFKKLVEIIRLIKFKGPVQNKKLEEARLIEDGRKIEIKGQDGTRSAFSIEAIEIFNKIPPELFKRLLNAVEENDSIEFSYEDDEEKQSEQINFSNKSNFSGEDSSEVILEGLKHNDFVNLHGHITKGNENANSIGFLFEGHIISCYPVDGNVKDYKAHIFTNCSIKGRVDRTDKDGNATAKRPKIHFTHIDGYTSSKQFEIPY